MKVGILEIMALPSGSLTDNIVNLTFTKQYASVTPQAISVWSRQLGHETFYATYYGVGKPESLLPRDLDLVFFCGCTLASPLIYALAKLYRKGGTFTVIGGPHAESFPADCLRFFDLVVKDCDKTLIADIIKGNCDRGVYISSANPFDDCPTVEERMPEIRASSLFQKKWHGLTTMVPIVSSMGCPYTCNFCTDWNSNYRLLSTERLLADIKYIKKNISNAIVAFHDPNFAIQFDRVFNVLEAVPPEDRVPYLMECSLSILNESRLQRLKETKCSIAVHGIESWQDYSNKVGLKNKGGIEKVKEVAKKLQQVRQYVPYIQANLMFGLDTDIGEEPIALTKEFMEKTPFAWPVINIPIPFGGTPIFDNYKASDRILKQMPFAFYYFPYLVTIIKNYDPVSFFQKLIELSDFGSSPEMLKRRIESEPEWKILIFHS
ncbi:MAG: radical SAM protein, partial [Okeania sp. SIO2H7]|nr:radical SAM protein [Okeania sp. SIO2H7]